MFIDCDACNGRGKRIEEGFDGRTARTCTECNGKGEILLTSEEERIMRAFLIDVENGLDAMETIREIETVLGAPAPATPMPMPVHEGMSAEWFDKAVKRAFDRDLSISRTARASVVAVSSSRDSDVAYLVTATECQCEGHRHIGRCYHRAYAIWYWWVTECDRIAAALTPEPVAA